MNNESMLKIAICDDEQPIRDYLKKLTEKCTDAQVHVFANGEELLSDPTVYDIILLDISLNRKPDSGKPNGMEVAKKIRETFDVIIIFVTALKEYVFEGYDVGAFHYLLKPVDEQKFMEVMDKAISQIKKEKNTQPLIIRMDGTKNMKEETYSFYEKMEVLEQKLGDHFFRSHRGFLVNLQEVVRYDNANIELKNGDRVFLAKQKYNDFVTAYMNYLRKA